MNSNTDYLNFTQVGNLVKDPEQVETATGKRYMRVNFAYGPKGQTSRNFVPVTIWLQDTNGGEYTAPVLHKGDFVKITGNLRQEQWIKEDGTKASIFRVHCNPKGITMLKAKAGDGQMELPLTAEEV